MGEKNIIIENERAILEILNFKLKNGITTGISENDYDAFIELLIYGIKKDEYEKNKKIIYEKKPFKELCDNVDKKIRPSYKNNVLYVTYQKGIIKPTYDLKLPEWREYYLFEDTYSLRNRLVEKSLKNFIKVDFSSSKTSLIKVENEKLNLAEKVGAFFVNDLITRYIKNSIEKKRWPSQCSDADKYIFDRDIASLIDEKGTKKTFKFAYYQAIRVIVEMMKKNNEIRLSNDDSNVLAYANFLKMLAPYDLRFLKEYKYDKYEMHNASIEVTIKENEAKLKTYTCADCDPYDDFGDSYTSEDMIINNNPVQVMKKRIGEIKS